MKTVKLTENQKETLDVIKQFIKLGITPTIADVSHELMMGWSSTRDRINSLVKAKLVVRSKKTKKISLK